MGGAGGGAGGGGGGAGGGGDGGAGGGGAGGGGGGSKYQSNIQPLDTSAFQGSQQNSQAGNATSESLVKQSAKPDEESERLLKALQERMNQPKQSISLPSLDPQTLFYFNEAQKAIQNLAPPQRLLNKSQSNQPIPPAALRRNRLAPYRINPDRHRSPASGTFPQTLRNRRLFPR